MKTQIVQTMDVVKTKKKQERHQEKKEWIQIKRLRRNRKISNRRSFRKNKGPRKSRDKRKQSSN